MDKCLISQVAFGSRWGNECRGIEVGQRENFKEVTLEQKSLDIHLTLAAIYSLIHTITFMDYFL